MSRTKSIEALLAFLPKDIPIEEAQRYFTRESACHLRVLVINPGKRANFWGKIRAHRTKMSTAVTQPVADESRPRDILRVWPDLITYMRRLTDQESEAEFV